MDDLTRERLARIALAQTREPGDLWLTRSVSQIGAVDLYDHLSSGRTRSGHAAQVATRLEAIDPERELDRTERLGLRFVVPGDDEWPAQVDDLAHTEAVDTRGGAPLGLWARGPRRLDDLGRSVAIVGSRSATTYGCDVAAEIAAGCGTEGWTVISGAAIGIDVAAHRGALAVGAGTVAVLACGADRVYPLAHEQLIEHIAEAGVVVSETIPGGAPLKARFLSRNRLISALSRGTVVVEAAIRSGALNSATWATRLNRPLMGVPGSVTSAVSQGVHELVRTGQATLVTTGLEVLDVVGELGEHGGPSLRAPERAFDRLTSHQRQVLEAVPSRTPAAAESIARTAGVRVDHAQQALDELFSGGLVTAAGQGWLLARQPEQGAVDI